MAKRHKRRARERRAELTAILGSQCAWCGTAENLTFDCIEPRGDKHHRMDTSHRMSFYFAEYRAGNLQLLCETCQNLKSLQERDIEEAEPASLPGHRTRVLDYIRSLVEIPAENCPF